jgi:hypothetical protein
MPRNRPSVPRSTADARFSSSWFAWLKNSQPRAQGGACSCGGEQLHAEIKTDLGLERLPSGKLETNDAIVHLAVSLQLPALGEEVTWPQAFPHPHPFAGAVGRGNTALGR